MTEPLLPPADLRPRDFSARLSVAFPLSGEAINDTKKSPRIYFLANKTF